MQLLAQCEDLVACGGLGSLQSGQALGCCCCCARFRRAGGGGIGARHGVRVRVQRALQAHTRLLCQ